MSSPFALALLISAMAAMGALHVARASRTAWTRYRDHFQDSASRHLSDMFLFLDPTQLFTLNIVILLLSFGTTVALGGGAILALLIACALAASPRWIYATMRRRRLRAAVSQLPDALLSMSTNLQAGSSLPQALEAVIAYQQAPLSQELMLVLRELRLGVPYENVMDNLHKRLPEVDVQLMTAAMKLSREIGGNLAETLERISDTLRRRLQMEGKIRSLTAQGQLQGLVMTGLPIFLVLALNAIEPRAMHYLFTAWYGWLTIGLVVLLEATGYHFIRKIVTIDV